MANPAVDSSNSPLVGLWSDPAVWPAIAASEIAALHTSHNIKIGRLAARQLFDVPY